MIIYRPGKDASLKTMPAKDPDATNKPYTILVQGNLPGDTTSAPATFLAAGVSVTSAPATTDDPLLIVESSTVAAGYVVVWLTGGTEGSVATVTVHVVTDLDNGAGGFYSDDISFKVPIKQR